MKEAFLEMFPSLIFIPYIFQNYNIMRTLLAPLLTLVSGAIHILSGPASVVVVCRRRRRLSSSVVRQLLRKSYLLPQFSLEFNETWETCRKQVWLKNVGSGILKFCLSQI